MNSFTGNGMDDVRKLNKSVEEFSIDIIVRRRG